MRRLLPARRGRTDRRQALRLGLEIAADAWLTRRPFLLYYKPTARCDCRCHICDRWQRPSRRDEEMALPEVERLLGRFRRAGAVVLTLWGGEPLLRDDLPQILGAAKALGFRTSLCTNGNRLAERATEVAGRLDVLLASLDGYGSRHDELRGVRGLFDRMVRGIELARREPSCEVKIWAVVHRSNRDDIPALARLARELDVGIEFFPLAHIAGHNDALVLSASERRESFGLVAELKAAGYPIRTARRALAIFQHQRPFRCNFPRIAISIDHRGQIHGCEDPQGKPTRLWSATPEIDLEALYRSPAFRAAPAELRACNVCTLPCMAELSGSLPRALADMLLSRTR